MSGLFLVRARNLILKKSDVEVKIRMARRRNWPPYNPRQTVPLDQLEREFPSIDKLTKIEKKEMENLVRGYLKFLDQSKTPRLLTQTVMNLAQNKGFSRSNRREKQNLFYIDNPERTAFALIKKGRRPLTEGINIFYAHNDSPCLIVKSIPTGFEWDPDKKALHNGVRLHTVPYGGTNPHQWFTKQCEMIGHFTREDGRTREISLPVRIPDFSQHTSPRGDDGNYAESFPDESLDAYTGHKSEKALLNKLGFGCKEDFASADLRIVPIEKSRRINDIVEGYGQDDSVCIYSGLRALFQSKPYYSSVLIGFDSEETEDNNYYSAGGGFFEEVMDEMILKLGKPKKVNGSGFIIDDLIRRSIYKKSLAISADVDAAATHVEESDQAQNIDQFNIGYLGYGTLLSSLRGVDQGHKMSTMDSSKFISLAKSSRAIFQIKGSKYTADDNEYSQQQSTFLAKRGIPICEIGPAGESLHSPNEGFHVGDIYSTFMLYRHFFNRRKKK